MAPVVLEGLRRLSENIKKREGGNRWFSFFYIPSVMLTSSSGFHPSCSYASQKIGKRQNKRVKGIKRQDRLGQLEINIRANAPSRANQPFYTLSCLVSAHSVVSYKMADMGENIPNGKGREKGYEQGKKGGWGGKRWMDMVIATSCGWSVPTAPTPPHHPQPHTHRRSVTAARKRRYSDF